MMAKKKKEVEVTLVSQLDTKKTPYKITGKVPRIETDVDKLYNLVKEKGKIKLFEAAKSLGVSEDNVREWGEILEEHKLIELHYPIAGKPSLGIRKPKKPREKIKKEKKPKKPGIPRRRRFTKRVILIYMEIIILGELLIYIFLVNRYLLMNFIPTVKFHLDGFISYLLSLPTILASLNFSALLSQSMYFAFLIILIIIIILIIVLIAKPRKSKLYIKEKEKKEKPKKEEKPKKKEAVFADIIERYKKRLKEMEK